MNWYYVEQGQQAGPVDDTQLEEMRRNGQIGPETLVWREGMANWAPYSEAKGEGQPPGPSGLRLATRPAQTAAAAPAAGADEAVCAECGGIFPIDQTIRYGNIHVCAHCKPIFMQKLTEGAQVETGVLNYAGFWIRFAAKFLDGLIIRVVAMPVGFAIGFTMRPMSPDEFLMMQVAAGTAGFLVTMGYTVFMTAKYSATLGKMACKIKIVTADGQPLSTGRAFGRYFAELLSSLTCLIGYIMAGFDSEKRALHDRVCNTRVVYK